MRENKSHMPPKCRFVWLQTSLFLPAIFAVTACVPIPIGRHDVELKEHIEPVSLENIRDVRVAPFYGEESLLALGRSLKKACPEAEILDSGDLWLTLFPTRDPDADAGLGELIDTSTAYRRNGTYISHFIVMRQLDTEYEAPAETSLKSSPFYYQGINLAGIAVTLVQLVPIIEARSISVDAEGKDTMIWFGHPLFHLSVSSKPDRKAVDAVTAVIENATGCDDEPGIRAVLLAGAES